MMHPENIDYTNTLIASIGLFGIILGAIITGVFKFTVIE
jgi:hypothetical protein